MIGHPITKLAVISLRQAWRLVVAVIGGTVIVAGLVMIVTPGPALVVIPMGLAILAIEFVWARRLLRRVKVMAKRRMRKFSNGPLTDTKPRVD